MLLLYYCIGNSGLCDVFQSLSGALTEHSMVSGEPTFLFLGDSTLVGLFEHSLQVIRNLGNCGGASFRPRLFLFTLRYLLLVYIGESPSGEASGRLEGLVGGVDAAYYHITFSAWSDYAVAQHHLVTQTLNHSFWSMVM